jgi:threonine dehydrogenase-like Zn-dependent dehydrogenase
MKAVVFHDIGDIRLEDVPEPKIEQPTDAIVRLTASAICGTDLHMVRGTMPGMKAGTILGHEGVGIVEVYGDHVRNLEIGDRVIIPSTIACGSCSYCRAGYYSQCDAANPNGPAAGTAFFGGPQTTGPFNGLQAEKARIPFAHVGLVKLPDEISDEQAIMMSDIFPTGWFGAELAEIKPGDTVAVFGCGPVGQFAIASAKLMGAGRVFAIDGNESRLDMARAQGAEIINFDKEDPVKMLKTLTGEIGADRAIDAVGVDSVHAHHGPAAKQAQKQEKEFQRQQKQAMQGKQPKAKDGNWVPGDAPLQAASWAVEALAKAGTLAIIGVYPETVETFPLGKAMNKNLTMKMGNCDHRRIIPKLVELVRAKAIDPRKILTKREPLTSAIDAFKAFDQRQPGWMKVELVPGQKAKEEWAPAAQI